ncbi:MAG: protein phosphatase 2C domain-containing protein [Alphaproteobacteria bacterium]|nr:protein phosphatase 2C domain-containing protein [Alphaproteobacteria bacterium]
MRTKLLQHICESSPDRAVNEDRVGWLDTTAWIIDGATGLTEERLLPGETDAAFFADIVFSAFEEHLRSPASGLWCLVSESIKEAFDANANFSAEKSIELPAAAAAGVRLDGFVLETFNIGDCVTLIRDREGGVCRFGSSEVQKFDNRVVALMTALREQGFEYPSITQHMKRQIAINRMSANTQEGYWVIDPTSKWIDHVQTNRTNVEGPCQLLLMSDGFYRARDVYNIFSTDSALFTEALLSDGLKRIQNRIREIEKRDTNCEAYPRIKASDDSSALLIEIH